MNYNDRSWAEVDLDSIKTNICNIKKYVGDNVKVMAVVKADAYGHGCMETAHTLIENGAEYLAVACVDEAILFRKRGINIPILILGYTHESRFEELIDNNITQTVFELDSVEKLSAVAVNKNKKAKVHIKVDTGMARIGFLCGYSKEDDEKTFEDICKISKLKGIDTEGIFTHFSVADNPDDEYTKLQFERFMNLVQNLEKKDVKFRYRHCCNSAGTLEFPEMHLDMVRTGIILYGCYPSENISSNVKITPAMHFKTRVINVKKIRKNSPVSYGKTYITENDMIVATIPVGYADGLPRELSNRAKVLVNGEFVPVLGRICMDQCMIDVTSVNNISVGDEVIIFGSDGKNSIPVESVAQLTNTINYEILCSVGKRIPRIYLKDGNVTKVLNFLK